MLNLRLGRAGCAGRLRLAALLLATARLLIRLGWRPEQLLCAALRASNRLSRSAIRARGRTPGKVRAA